MLSTEFRKFYQLSEPIEVTPYVLTYDAAYSDGSGMFTYTELHYTKAFNISTLPTLNLLEDFKKLSHPSIIPIHEIVYDPYNHIVGILVERMTDMTLRDLINDFAKHRMQLPEEQIWDIISQVVRAMQYCHMMYKHNCPTLRRVVHRCLHPGNIFINDEGIVRVGFPELAYLLGCIKACDLSPSIQRYLAPEVIIEDTISDRSDVWSMGVIFYELCILTPLFPLVQKEELINHINALRTHVVIPGYSFNLCELINGMLNREPLHRLSTYELLHYKKLQDTLLKYQLPTLSQRQRDAQHSVRLSDLSYQENLSLQLTAYSLNQLSINGSKESVERRKAQIHRLQNDRYKPEKFDAATRLRYNVGYMDPDSTNDFTYRGKDSVVTGKPYSQINFELKYGNAPDKYNKVHRNDSAHSLVESTTSLNIPAPPPTEQESITDQQSTQDPSKSNSRVSTRTKSKQSRSRASRGRSVQSTVAKSGSDQTPPVALEEAIDQYVRKSRSGRSKQINTESSTVSITMTSALAQTLPIPEQDKAAPTITNSNYKPAAKLDSNLDLWVDDIVVNVLQKRHGYYTMEDIRNRLFEIVPGMQLEPGVSVHSPSDLIAIQILAEEVERRLEPYKTLFSSTKPQTQPQAINTSILRNSANYEPSSASGVTEIFVDSMSGTENQQTKEINRRTLKSSRPKSRQFDELPPHERIRKADPSLPIASAVSAALFSDPDVDSSIQSQLNDSTRQRLLTLDDYNEQKSILGNADSDAWKNKWSKATYSQNLSALQTEDPLQYVSRPIQYTNLMKAATLGDIDNVKLLISLEAGVTTRHKVTALMLAAAAGHTNVIEALIPYEGKCVDNDGLPALSYAVKGGHMEACKVLAPLEAGIIAKNGLSPLMIACDYNQVSIAFVLKDYGARLHTPLGVTALMRSAQRNNYPLCKTLIDVEATMQNNAGETAMLIATKDNYVQIVELLIEREHRIPNAQGVSALMIAAARNFVEIAKMLHHKECGMKDMYDETALMKAAKAGALDVAALLLESEGGIAREDGKTAMMYAAEVGHLEMVDLLLKKECTRAMKDGTTALMLAAQRNNQSVVEVLARFEAKRQRITGETALMLAMRHRSIDAIKTLINYEGDIEMYNGTTVRDVAELTGDPLVIQAIEERFS